MTVRIENDQNTMIISLNVTSDNMLYYIKFVKFRYCFYMKVMI